MKTKKIEDIYPLTPMQQGMLFHTLYAPNSGVYVEQLTCSLHGALNIWAFEQAWQRVMDRHQVLRTAFVWEGVKNPYQVVGREVKVPFSKQDWRGLSKVEQQQRLVESLIEDRNRGFELSKAPLMRMVVIQMSEDSYQFIWSYHHILTDGWCSTILFKEVLAFYQAYSQGLDLQLAESRPYRDYIEWLQRQDMRKAEAYWRKTLKGFTAPTRLLLDNKNLSNEQSFDIQSLRLSTATTASLRMLTRRHKLTLNTLLEGVWAILLSRYTGETDVIFGATVSGRPPELAGIESMVGLFINTLPVRIQVVGEALLFDWLSQLQAKQVEMRQYEYSPLFEIQKWSEVEPGTPLFETILIFENYPTDLSLQKNKGNIEIDNVQMF
ncbi:MAG: condensation domain-containing protein, partial [Acidobacteriota bacterium]